VLGRELLARGLRVTCAESCTGGLLASLLTSVPGISAVFTRGWVTYSDQAKAELLGVEPALLARHGAVSREVAEALARGAAERAGAELALAVTGIAGPQGGTIEKPVGLVFLATCWRGEVESAERRFAPHGREMIRLLSARSALFLAWRRLREPAH
jgi:PncC family amidohydrolase